MLGTKVTWVMTVSCYYTILGNVLLVNGHRQSPTFCKGLNISRMQAFVRLPTEFDNLLLNAAGYFDVSPNPIDYNNVRYFHLFVICFSRVLIQRDMYGQIF